MAKLTKYKEIIDGKPIHIATVTPEHKPNLAVASDVMVLDDDSLVISVNEMTRTQENIKLEPMVVITAFDKDWQGVRIFGEATLYEDGKYYDLCKEKFFGKGEVTPFGATSPKGAIVVKITDLQEYA